MTSTQHNHHLYLSNSSSKIPVSVNRSLHINSLKNDSILSKNCDFLQYDTGTYTKAYLRSNNKQKSFQSHSLQSSPSNNSIYKNRMFSSRQHPHSTNCTPRHFYKSSLQNFKFRDYKNNVDYLDHDISVSSEINNSSNDELDNNFGSINNELNFSNDENSKIYLNQSIQTKNKSINNTIRHSNSLNNNISKKSNNLPKNSLIKPTSLSFSGNNLSFSQNESYSPNSGVKYEAFIMTGEVILNLATSNSKDNCLIFGSKSVNDLEINQEFKQKLKKSNSNNNQITNHCINIENSEKNFKENSTLNNTNIKILNDEVNTNIVENDYFNKKESLSKNLIKFNDSTNSNEEKNLSLPEDNLIINFEKNSTLSINNKNLNEIEKEDNKLTLNNNDLTQNKNSTNLLKTEKKLNLIETIDDTLNKRYPSFILSELEENLALGNHCLPPRTVDMASAKRLAKRLYNLDKFKKSDVSRHLCKNNEFTKAVTEEYLSYFDFTNQTLLEALRSFLEKFTLIGETQERERILIFFSRRYFECNKNLSFFKSSDVVHTLTCAIMMLNSDLHGKGISYKMTMKKFIDNLSHLNDGENFSNDFLRSIYIQIKNNKLQWSLDEERNQDKIIQFNLIKNNVDNLPISNIIFDVPNSLNSIEYKKGYLLRKCCYENNSKKTPFGKRGWKLFYATLRDMVLYLHKNDQGFSKSQIYSSLKNSIKIHHSLASIATDYDKREYVFRLKTADGAIYLFCLSNNQELDSWVDTINFVAGSFSAPPMPSPIGSQTLKKLSNKFIFSANFTNLNFNEQLTDHLMRKINLKQEIHTLNNKIKNNNLSKKVLKEYNFILNNLINECERYNAYIMVMNKVKPSNTSKFFEKTLNFNISKTISLTTTVIGEEQIENEDEEKSLSEKSNSFKDKLNK